MSTEQQRASRQGVPSDGNTTFAALGASESFTGAWDVNDYDHVYVNIKTDQPGTVFIDIGVQRPDGSVDVMFTRSVPVYANTPSYQALSKGAGRTLRIRYENGDAAQTTLTLATGYGSNLLPTSASEDNEILVTVTEQERDVHMAVQGADISADTYMMLIDLDDTTNFPHDRTGSVDLTNTYFGLDRGASATGFVRIGVITRIDGTSADVSYVAGVTFQKTDARSIFRDRKYSPSQMRCLVEGGKLAKVATSFIETNDVNLNTGVALETHMDGLTVTPDVGDVIVKFGFSGTGTYTASASVFYHGNL